MPAKRRTTRQKAKNPPKLSPEDQMKREQCDLLILDLEKNAETVINEVEREKESIINSIMTSLKLELLKIPKDIKNANWMEFYQEAMEKDINPLEMSDAINKCLDDTLCVQVDEQVNNLKSAIKTAKKRGRPGKKENEPGTAVRQSSRKRNKSADESATDSVLRTSSRSRTRGLVDATNLQTPAQGRSKRGQVPETPVNCGPPGGYGGMTPMITPKFDTTKLTRTVTRVAKDDEVLLSLSGSPVAPLTGMRSKAAKQYAKTHAQLPLPTGQNLNLPFNGEFDLPLDAAEMDDQTIEQMQQFALQLQNSVAAMKRAREQKE